MLRADIEYIEFGATHPFVQFVREILHCVITGGMHVEFRPTSIDATRLYHGLNTAKLVHTRTGCAEWDMKLGFVSDLDFAVNR